MYHPCIFSVHLVQINSFASFATNNNSEAVLVWDCFRYVDAARQVLRSAQRLRVRGGPPGTYPMSCPTGACSSIDRVAVCSERSFGEIMAENIASKRQRVKILLHQQFA